MTNLQRAKGPEAVFAVYGKFLQEQILPYTANFPSAITARPAAQSVITAVFPAESALRDALRLFMNRSALTGETSMPQSSQDSIAHVIGLRRAVAQFEAEHQNDDARAEELEAALDTMLDDLTKAERAILDRPANDLPTLKFKLASMIDETGQAAPSDWRRAWRLLVADIDRLLPDAMHS